MDIKAVSFNVIQKTNFGNMTNSAREHLNYLKNLENSGIDADGEIKLSYFDTTPDFILDYQKDKHRYIFHSTDSYAWIDAMISDKKILDTGLGNVLRALFRTSLKLDRLSKDKAKRTERLTIDDVETK